MTQKNTSDLSLYQYNFCPFCMTTRNAIKKLGIEIEIRDTMKTPKHRQTLFTEGGKSQVPCLRIEQENGVKWMYESAEIIAYLKKRFG